MLPINQQFSEDQGPQIGVFEAAFEREIMDTFVGGHARDTVLDEMDGPSTKKLNPEELNSKYPEMEVPFSKPMSDLAAFHLHEEAQKRQGLQRAIDEAPGGTFYKQAVSIGASLVAHALDPVEFGVGAFTGLGIKGVGTLIKGSQAALRSAGVAKFGDALTKSGFAVEASEGIAGNALLEPFMYQQQSRAQVDYGIEDAFLSVVGGGIAMPVLKKAFSSVIGLPDTVTGMAVKNSIGQAMEGYRPTPEIHAKTYNDIAFKQPVEGAPIGSVRADYKFEPMDISGVKEKTFYMTGASIDESKTIGEFFGEGSYLTDNPHFANNIAAHPMDDTISEVFEVALDDVKLLDIDNIQETELQGNWKTASPEKIEEMVAKAKEFGYEGLSQADSKRGHNSIHLFPEAKQKIKEQGRFKPDVKAVSSLDPKEVENISSLARSRENELGFDAELDKEFNEFILPEEYKSIESAAREAEIDDTLNRLGSMEKEGFLSQESKEILEEVKQSKLERQSRLEVIKDFATCLLSGV